MMSHQIDDVVSPDATAKAWDEYLRRFGPSAYVAARYIHAVDPSPPEIDRVRERGRPTRLTSPAYRPR